MSHIFSKFQIAKQNPFARLWMDRLDLRGDTMNISDQTLHDVGLYPRYDARANPSFYFN